MNTKKFSEAMSEIDDKYVDEAIRYKCKAKKYNFIKRGILAACLVLVLVLIIGALIVIPQKKIVLSNNSIGVTVKYTFVPLYIRSRASLIYLSEEELFTEFDTAIFKGVVTAIDNIVMNFNGSNSYRAIAQIEVEKVYRDNCKENETVSILLPCPIASNFHVTDTEVISKIERNDRYLYADDI